MIEVIGQSGGWVAVGWDGWAMGDRAMGSCGVTGGRYDRSGCGRSTPTPLRGRWVFKRLPVIASPIASPPVA